MLKPTSPTHSMEKCVRGILLYLNFHLSNGCVILPRTLTSWHSSWLTLFVGRQRPHFSVFLALFPGPHPPPTRNIRRLDSKEKVEILIVVMDQVKIYLDQADALLKPYNFLNLLEKKTGVKYTKVKMCY